MKNRCILRKYFTKLAMIIVLAVVLPLVACVKESEAPTGNITMTAKGSKVSFSVEGARDITVNWGDGKQSNVDDATVELSGDFTFSHVFSGTTDRSIVITGNVTKLSCYELTTLDVSRCATLEWLYCAGSLFTSLDVSKNTALTFLSLSYGSQLTSLDVSKNTALTTLTIGDSQIKNLDVSRNTSLKSLIISRSQLTTLDLSANTALTSLSVLQNQLTAAVLNELFKTLKDKHVTGGTKHITIRGNPGFSDCNRSIAEEKGWFFQDRPSRFD